MRTLYKTIFLSLFYVVAFMSGYLYSERVNAGGCGTASFINNQGYLMTAQHVVGNKNDGIIFYGNKIYAVKVVYRNRYRDVAFIKTGLLNHPFLTFVLGFQKGDLAFYGYPRVNIFGSNLKVSIGMGYTGYSVIAGRTVIYYYANSYPGYSGSPILNQQGQVIGILTTGFVDSLHTIPNGGSNYGYGTTSEDIIRSAQEAGIPLYAVNNSQNINFYNEKTDLEDNKTVVYFCTGNS